MIDVNSETLLSLSEAARRMPRRRAGRPCHVATVHRWVARGCHGVKLEAVKLGGAFVTSAQALQRFAEACTHAANGDTAPAQPAARQHEATDAALAEIGI